MHHHTALLSAVAPSTSFPAFSILHYVIVISLPGGVVILHIGVADTKYARPPPPQGRHITVIVPR